MTRIAQCLLVLMSFAALALAQDTPSETAMVTGRVVRGDKPAVGVLVMAQRMRASGGWEPPGIFARTDSNGHYELTGLSAVNYLIFVATTAEKVYIEGQPVRAGKTVVPRAGEKIEGIDFSLVKGGVITGTITDENGKPAVDVEITLLNYVMKGKSTPHYWQSNNFMNRTDDRGVYRLFGLTPGKYIVRIGNDSASPAMNLKSFPLTFYPGVAEESRAKMIEVAEGGEVTDIDLKLPKPETLFVAKGRAIDAATGQPLVGVRLGYNALKTGEEGFGSGQLTRERTSAQGEFQLPGLHPGSYVAYLRSEDSGEYYSEPLRFEVVDSDVNGLEMKVARGGSISGLVAVEETKAPKLLSSLSSFQIFAQEDAKTRQLPYGQSTTINPDGSFRLTGLAPGNIRLTWGFGGMGAALPRQFPVLLRIEKDGGEIPNSLPIKAGENIAGVRVVMGFGTGIVRGQVAFINGTLPAGVQLQAVLRKVNPIQGAMNPTALIDANGRFLVEGLFAGEYQLAVSSFGQTRLPMEVIQRMATPQMVTVNADAETPINVTLDLRTEGKQ